MPGLRKFHFTHQKVNFFKVKFKISVVNFLVFSVEQPIILRDEKLFIR